MPADTFSNTLGYIIMGTGNDNNTWGANANVSAFQIFEDAIANALTSAVTGGTLDLSGSPPPAGPSQVRYAALIFTGALGSNQIIKVPNIQKFWFVQNNTSGASTLKIQTPSGSASTAIPQNGGWQIVSCDGANNIVVQPFNTKQIQMPDGSLSAPPYSDINETNSGWRRAGTQDWRLTINGADVLQVTGTGAGSPNIVNILAPNVLQVQGAQPIPPGTVAPYDGIALPSGGWLWADGTAYSRATYAPLFNAITATTTGNTNSNTSITNLAADMRGQGLDGAFVEGTGIPTGTTITFTGATTATLSQAASSTNPGITLRFLPWGQGDASTTFNVSDRRYRSLFGRDDMNNNNAGRSSAFAGKRLNTTGGEESHTLVTGEIPSHQHAVFLKDSGHTHTYTAPLVAGIGNGGSIGTSTQAAVTGSSTTGITIGSVNGVANDNQTATAGGGASHNNMPTFGVTNYIIKT